MPVDDSSSCFHAKKFTSVIASKFESVVTAIHVTTHECIHPELKVQYRLPLTVLQKIEEAYLKSGKKILRKAFVPDRYIDTFQGRAPKNVLAKHYNPHGITMLKEIYEKANLTIFYRN